MRKKIGDTREAFTLEKASHLSNLRALNFKIKPLYGFIH